MMKAMTATPPMVPTMTAIMYFSAKVIKVRYEDMRLNWEHYVVSGEEI